MMGWVYVLLAVVLGAATYTLVRLRLRANRERAEEAVRALDARYEDLYDHAPDMMALVDAASESVVQCNQTLADGLKCRKDEILGRSVLQLYAPESVEAARQALAAFRASGEVYNAELVLRRRDGTGIYVSQNISAVRDGEGRVVRGRSVWHDVTQRRVAEEALRESLVRQHELLKREKTLLRELNHRVRNNLAGLLGLVGLYERSGKSAAEIGQAIRGQIRAMKEVHDMISRSQGSPIDLRTLVKQLSAEMGAGEGGGRVVGRGPPVEVPHAQAVALAMIVQELLTNACKYGALSVPGGAVQMTWNVGTSQAGSDLEVYWEEAGGPPPPREPARGIGMGLIEGLARAELQGSGRFDFEPRGLRFVLTARLESPLPAGEST